MTAELVLIQESPRDSARRFRELSRAEWLEYRQEVQVFVEPRLAKLLADVRAFLVNSELALAWWTNEPRFQSINRLEDFRAAALMPIDAVAPRFLRTDW